MKTPVANTNDPAVERNISRSDMDIVIAVSDKLPELNVVYTKLSTIQVLEASVVDKASEVAANTLIVQSETSTTVSNAASALASKNAAGLSEINASNSESVATMKASEASVSASNALISETNANNSEIMAHKWAQEAEDVEVAQGEYSAKHWATKARNIVYGGLTATNVSYNNDSVLTATNIQDAIDELLVEIGTTKDALVSDHTLLSNIGTNTHAQIDSAITRLANTSGTNTGDQIITLTGDVSGSGTDSFIVTLKDTGTAGTYRSVTTDAQGRVISGTNPTTVNGYGLTDVYTKTEVNSMIPTTLPASDVYAWAKASTKPEYTALDVGLGNVTNEGKSTMFNNPTFTGTPVAPTAAADTSTTQLATTAFAIPRVTGVDNAIVRFDGTTGKVQTSNITIDDSGNIGSGAQSFNGFGGSGFKNYIINGNFDVWQRGTSFSAVGYCADRWYLAIGGSANATKHNVFPNTVLMTTTTASSFANLYQAIETATVIGLRGKTLTLSLKLQTGGTHTGGFVLSARYSSSSDTLNSQTTNIQSIGVSTSSTNTRYSLTFTVPADAVGLRIDIENTSVQPSGALYQVQEVQLEEGSVATPFENRPYALELSLCKRYARDIGNSSLYGQIGNGFAISTTSALIEIDVNDMRIVPTISNTLTANLFEIEYANGAGTNRATCTAIAINSSATANNNKLNLIITVGGGLTAGQCVGFRNNNTSTNKIILSAEL